MGAQVEQLLLIDLRDSRRVRAAHVVGLDLEAWDRVGVGTRGDQEVAGFLEGVGLLRSRVHDDVALPHRGRAAAEDAPERQIGGGVGRSVLLSGVEVDVLSTVSRVCTGDPRLGARST